MHKAIAFGVGIVIGTVAETGIMVLARSQKWDTLLLSIPFTALILLSGALIGREAARHGAYRAGYHKGYTDGERHLP
ncbi:MAG: hypothetical protein ABF449_02850 [Ethanoligenens sp.]